MRTDRGLTGAYWAVVAVSFFAFNDAAIKFLSDDYALHQVVLIRSVIALVLISVFVVPFTGGRSQLRTRKPGMHLLRGLFIVIANMTFFLGLAAMPLAEAVAIFFISPLLITVFSVIFLSETVGPWRWGAIAGGLVGVIIVVRPGSDAFQLAAVLPLIAAGFYAGVHILTRQMGGTESAVTMVLFMQSVFILVSGAIGLVVADGQFDRFDDPSLQFFFRAWVWPAPQDVWLFGLVGIGIAGAAIMISQAYRVSEAALVAPFEYVALPLAIFFGIVVFDEYPDAMALLGSGLIVGGGLVLVWREARAGKGLAQKASR